MLYVFHMQGVLEVGLFASDGVVEAYKWINGF